jgi:hypothetical protein
VSNSSYLKGLGLKTVPWISHKKLVPTDSITKEKYVAAAEVKEEIFWLNKILEYLQEKQVNSTPLLVNNTSAIKLAKNPKLHD